MVTKHLRFGFIINPFDAKKLGICTGDIVRITSRRGKIKAKAKITDVSGQGTIFMTFHFHESPTNTLTNPAVDPIAKAKTEQQLKGIIADMKGDLEGILNFIEQSGLYLDDHYMHIRDLARSA